MCKKYQHIKFDLYISIIQKKKNKILISIKYKINQKKFMDKPRGKQIDKLGYEDWQGRSIYIIIRQGVWWVLLIEEWTKLVWNIVRESRLRDIRNIGEQRKRQFNHPYPVHWNICDRRGMVGFLRGWAGNTPRGNSCINRLDSWFPH